MNASEINTDDYGFYYDEDHETTGALQGSPSTDPETGDLVYDPKYLFTKYNDSTMDMDDINTGLMNDFWTDYPVVIDINGNIFYHGDFTGINVRGPSGLTNIRWEDLTEEQKAELKGQDGTSGINGLNGRDGIDGVNGLSAYEVWLQENGWLDDPEHHPVEDFYAYIASLVNDLVKEGAGTGSLIITYHGEEGAAAGQGALSAGYGTSAVGDNSIALGSHTTASRNSSLAIGQYNESNSDNLFEIGNGTSVRNSNAFSVDYQGNTHSAGNITDGSGNTLSNKVNKEQGKGLSTNDFENSYKDFIDNYNIDNIISASSTNPVENRAIAEAIEQARADNVKVRQNLEQSDVNLSFAHPAVQLSGETDVIKYTTDITFNPFKKNFLLGTTTTNSKVFGFGEGLLANDDNQIVLGYYNNPQSTDILEIGAGTSANRKNIFSLSKDGDLTTAGEIIDKNGNKLSDKQNMLQYDTVPTANSTKLVNSGNLYNYFNDYTAIFNGELTPIRTRLTTLEQAVTTLNNRINAIIQNEHEIVDDTITSNVYNFGINNGEFYIKLQEPPQQQEEIEGDE